MNGVRNNSTLMVIATIGTLGILYVLLFKEIPKDNITVLLAIGGPLLGFYFGSSVNKSTPDPTLAALDAATQQAINTMRKGA